MKKATKKAALKTEPEIEQAPVVEDAPEHNVKHTRVIRAVTPYTDEMMSDLESRLDALAADGFEIVSCVPYGVDHMVILLQKAAA